MSKRKADASHPPFDKNCPKCLSEVPGSKTYRGKHICSRTKGGGALVASAPPGSEDGSEDGGDGLSPEEVEARRVLSALDQEMVDIEASKASKIARVDDLKTEIGAALEEMAKIFQRLKNKDEVDSQLREILPTMINMLLNQIQSARKQRR